MECVVLVRLARGNTSPKHVSCPDTCGCRSSSHSLFKWCVLSGWSLSCLSARLYVIRISDARFPCVSGRSCVSTRSGSGLSFAGALLGGRLSRSVLSTVRLIVCIRDLIGVAHFDVVFPVPLETFGSLSGTCSHPESWGLISSLFNFRMGRSEIIVSMGERLLALLESLGLLNGTSVSPGRSIYRLFPGMVIITVMSEHEAGRAFA